jgi:murein DD-endopeptidase MepM/ murein hydrolase activator NlpD
MKSSDKLKPIILITWALISLACTRHVAKDAEVYAALQEGQPAPLTSTPDLRTAEITEKFFEAQSTIEPQGTLSPSPSPSPTIFVPTPTVDATQYPPILYYTNSGDTLQSVAARFYVSPDEITSPDLIDPAKMFPANQLLIITNRIGEIDAAEPVIPDAEFLNSATVIGFNTIDYVNQAGGYLASYKEWFNDAWYTGGEIVEYVAINNSINPRLLLTILEYQSGWVFGQPTTLAEIDYPMGWKNFSQRGLYRQLNWAVQQLSIGYYGWRSGSIVEITFKDHTTARISPEMNAGSVAMQYLFSKNYDSREWGGALYSPEGVIALYENLFGNPWPRAKDVEPIFPDHFEQPEMNLPFLPNRVWSHTGGPHAAWVIDGPNAALDFAPATISNGCIESNQWVTAAAPGLVVRSEPGIVIVDLDGDGYEQTGWAILYMHIATNDRVKSGTWVDNDDYIGHPSCEGGRATGTHLHIARKYNGEWIPADGPVPFVLSGWVSKAGSDVYEGWLVKDNQTVTASTVGEFESRISRNDSLN